MIWGLSIAALSILLFHGRICADEIQKFDAKPVSIVDRFDVNSMNNYKTLGKVRWSTLKTTIPEGSALFRQNVIDANFQCEFDVWPTKFNDHQQCVSQIRFVCTNGWEIVTVISRQQSEGRIARQVAIAEIQRSGQGSEPMIEQLGASPVFSIPGDCEHWRLSYNNGLVEVRCNDQVVVLGCGEAFCSWCQLIGVAQASGESELSKFSLHGRLAGYSPDQQKIYDRTNQLRAEAEQALAEGDIKRALEKERQRIPLMEQAFGKDYVAIALTHQWMAEIADNMQRYEPAKRLFRQSADVFSKSLGEKHPQTLRTWVGRLRRCFIGQLGRGRGSPPPSHPDLRPDLRSTGQGHTPTGNATPQSVPAAGQRKTSCSRFCRLCPLWPGDCPTD